MSHFFARLAQNTLTAHPMPKAQLPPAATLRSTNAAWDNVELPLVNSLGSIQDEKKEINQPASEPQVDLIKQPLTLAKVVSKPQIAREQGSFPLDIANNAVVPVKEKPVSSAKDGKMLIASASRPSDPDASLQTGMTNHFRIDVKKEDNVTLRSAGLIQSVIDPVAAYVPKKEIPFNERESSPQLSENKKRDLTHNAVILAKEWPVSSIRDDKKVLTHSELPGSSSLNKESFLRPLTPSVIKVSSDDNIHKANTKDTATLTDSIPLNAASIAPNVHVHIGRLEIRAAKPKAPLAVNRSQRQSKPRAKPALSLREYLKKYPGESV
jgi:hypothetical protein